MLKNITAIGLIILFAGATAAPFIHLGDCEMPCCIKVEKSCCDMKKDIDCPTMSDCGTSVFMPIVSGPFHKADLKTTDAVINFSIQNYQITNNKSELYIHRIESDPGPIAHLNLPLLI
ncbi:MAG: hypothetical protein HOD97_06870 [Candidatus Marinimicrobia bacterium]|jgi:hypothetical protein|nr:hypothetical protein [Candidatus Neomarinimicrobiota bacterium]MBT3617306.1 hypothetical protein [Candidatus Neomarinimicrobiota bacterium]MBT3828869.1 hypothetical protein [Candidatus Neomarinimicrobiota bacterium]MBT3996694.1 hypothetical protein [Candidatus Neomarinimicrobiota bacterium]MBT4281319.1 hypothetical protein [Candidatus Neomarinimicrobiota bacterium]